MPLKIVGTPPRYSNCYHFHASPKYRRAVFNSEIGHRLQMLLHQKSGELGWSVHACVIDADHVHFIVEAKASPSDIASRLFGFASYILRKEFVFLKEVNDGHFWGGRQCTVIKCQEHYDNAVSYIGRHRHT